MFIDEEKSQVDYECSENEVVNDVDEDLNNTDDENQEVINDLEVDTSIDDNKDEFENELEVEQEDLKIESADKKDNKNVKYVKKSTLIVTTIIAVLLALIIGIQLCFVTIASIYDKKYQNYINEYIEEFKKNYNSANNETAPTNKIDAAIQNVTSLYDKYYLYNNMLYEDDVLDELIKYYVELTGDKYSHYYTKQEWAEEQKESSGNGYGIGIYYNVFSNYEGFYVLYVMNNTPAQKAGLMAGDVIIKIDDLTISDDYYAGVAAIRGEKDSSSIFTVLRGDEILTLEIVRDDYNLETVITRVYEENNKKIGYLRLLQFDSNTTSQFKTKLDLLLNDNCESIIFDLRDNLGGDINSVLEILDKLLPEGPIMYYTDLDGNIVESFSSDKNEVTCDMVVLVNGATASAAELFCSALRDYDKAVLVGEQTYGKGCILSGYYTKTGGVLYMTSLLYKTAKSDCFDKIGLTPDYIVELDNNENLFKLTFEEDIQLQKALELLK